jgi:hypothetical protein
VDLSEARNIARIEAAHIGESSFISDMSDARDMSDALIVLGSCLDEIARMWRSHRHCGGTEAEAEALRFKLPGLTEALDALADGPRS